MATKTIVYIHISFIIVKDSIIDNNNKIYIFCLLELLHITALHIIVLIKKMNCLKKIYISYLAIYFYYVIIATSIIISLKQIINKCNYNNYSKSLNCRF